MNRFFTAIALLQFTSLVAQPLGQTYRAGITSYELQRWGGQGKMIAQDSANNMHVVWTNDFNGFYSQIYYNVWRTDSGQFAIDLGRPISEGLRNGFASLVLTTSGFPVAAYDSHNNDYQAELYLSCWDSGAFYAPVPRPDSLVHLWPVISLSSNNILHAVTLTANSNPNIIYYSRGELVEESGICDLQWTEFGSHNYIQVGESNVLGHTVTSSRRSDRTAIGWLAPAPIDSLIEQFSNDVKIAFSNDAGLTWMPPLNITQFYPVDTLCCDTTDQSESCIRDTLSAYTDLALHFDRNDVLHATFTARSLLGVCNNIFGENVSWINQSLLYHWSEATNQFSLIADGYWPWPELIMDDGAWQLNVQRPCLAEDTTTGFLYCAYMQYDTNCYSIDHFPSADIYVSVSTDGGSRWSNGTNVTRTCEGHGSNPGFGQHERDHSLAEYVTNGFLHLFHCLDRDAGTSIYNEGVPTENDMLYQRIPVDSIPTTPLIENYPLHWDSTGFYAAADNPRAPLPTEITLHAYPNPFNSTTNIEFTLTRSEKITLKIHDILGREVTTLANKTLPAGTHNLSWRADNISSGLYFVSLLTSTQTHTQKLLLLR